MGLTQRFLDHRQVSGRIWPVLALALLATSGGPVRAQEEDRGSDGADPGVEEARPAVPRHQAAYHFARAKLLSDTGQFEEALAAFRRSLELDASDPYSLIEVSEFHAYLAQISRSQGKQAYHLQAAAEHATRAREIDPENVDVLRSYAQVQMRLVEQHQLESLGLAREAFEKLRERREGDLHALISLGQIYLWQREPAKAAEVLTEAASFRPNHPTIEGLLVDAHLTTGKLAEAEKILERIVARDPSALDQRLQLAELRSDRGDHRGAVGVLKGGPQTQFVNPRLRRILARELHLSGDNEEALAVTETLLEDLANSGSVRRLRVSILSGLVRYEEAIGELEHLIDPEEDGEQSLQDELFLSRLLERIGRSEEAADRLRTLIGRTAETQALQVKLALVSLLERQGRAGDAVELLSAELHRANARAAAGLAQVLGQLLARHDRDSEALAVLDRVLGGTEDSEVADRLRLQKATILAGGEAWKKVLAAARPLLSSSSREVRVAAYVRTAEALEALGRTDEALATLRRGEEDLSAPGLFARRLEILLANDRAAEAGALLADLRSSDDPDDLLFVAQVHQRAGRFEEAIPVLARLLDQDPTSLQVRFFLGAAYERAGQHERAVSTFQALLERSPDHAPALNYLGYMWAERAENLDDALALIQRAVALEPDNGAYVDSLGWAYYQLGRYEEARRHLEWAVRLVPDDPTILEHLGDLYTRLQDLERARDSYRQALDLGGGDSVDEVRRKLETLQQEGL